MADKLEAGCTKPIHYSAPATRLARDRSNPGVVFLDPNGVDLNHIGGSDNEVGDGADPPLGGRLRVKIVGLERRQDRGGDGVSGGVGDESRGAVLDPRRPVHHLEGGVAHRRRELGFLGFRDERKMEVGIHGAIRA